MMLRSSYISMCCLLCVCVGLWGCDERPETAQDTFKQYLRHVFLNQEKESFALIAPQDREQLLVLKSELTQAGAAHPLEDHETLLVRAIINPYAIRSIEIKDDASSADEATLVYTLVTGREGEAKMVRVEGDWYLKVLN